MQFLKKKIHFFFFVFSPQTDNNGKGRSALYLVRVPIDAKEAFDRQMRKYGYDVLHDTGGFECKLWVLKGR